MLFGSVYPIILNVAQTFARLVLRIMGRRSDDAQSDQIHANVRQEHVHLIDRDIG